jgi:hypothetical protein
MTNRSRAEGLSFVLQKQVENRHIKENIITTVGVNASTKELVFTFRDGTIKKFARQSAGTSQASVVVVSSAAINASGELVVALSNGEIYNFGVVTRPENFDNYTGTGVYVGGTDPLVFKPIVAGPGVTVTGPLVEFQNLGEVDPTFDGYVAFTNNIQSGSASAGAFRTRVLNLLLHGITGVSVASSVIRLPKGKYYIKGWAKSYRTNYFVSRLFNNTTGLPLLIGTSTYAQVGGGYNAEPHSSFSGYVTLEEDSDVILQAYYSTSYSSHSLSVLENLLEIWKVSS